MRAFTISSQTAARIVYSKRSAEALPPARGSHLLPLVLAPPPARLRRQAVAAWDQAVRLQGSRLRRRARAAAHTLRTGDSRRQRDARRVAAAAARYGAAAAGRPPPVLRIPPIALPHAPRPTHGPGGRGGGRAGRSQAGLLRRVASGPRHRRAGTCRSKLEGSTTLGAGRAGSADELGVVCSDRGRTWLALLLLPVRIVGRRGAWVAPRAGLHRALVPRCPRGHAARSGCSPIAGEPRSGGASVICRPCGR